MMFLSLLFRTGRPMLTGAVLAACGIALVAAWALTGADRAAALLVRLGILAALGGTALMARTAYRRRHQPSPPSDQKRDASQQ